MLFKQCACCGGETLEAGSKHDVCPICGWEDDPIQNKRPDYDGGANCISLNTARKAFAEGKSIKKLEKTAWDQFLKQEEENTGAGKTRPPAARAV